jgi:hypothetical protein
MRSAKSASAHLPQKLVARSIQLRQNPMEALRYHIESMSVVIGDPAIVKPQFRGARSPAISQGGTSLFFIGSANDDAIRSDGERTIAGAPTGA